jgi:hypothetical protein
MVTFSSEVNPPGGASYAPPNISQWLSSFLSGSIGDLPQDYYQGKFNAQKGQENDLALQQQRAFSGGLPTDAQGNPDYRKIVQMLAQKGDINAITQLAPYVKDQGAGTLSPILGGNGAAPAPPNGGAGPYSAPSPAATSAPPASAGLAQSTGLNARAQDITQGGDGEGPTVKQFVSARLPNGNSAQAGDLESRIAMQMDLDPNAPMTAGQQRRALGLFNRYAGTNEAAPPAAGAPAPTSAPTFTMPATAPPNAGSPAERVAQGFGGLPPQNQPLQPQPQVQGGPMPAQPQPQQQPQQPPNRSGLPPTTAAVLQPPQPPQQQAGAGAPQQGQQQGQQQQPQGPIGPQVPLPKGFTDPEQAIMALRREAATNPHPKQAAFADQWAKDIGQSIQPMPVGATQTLVDPRTGKVVYQGASAAGFGSTEAMATLDADAARYRETGTLPPNMGRGAQGQQLAAAIRTRAVEQEVNEGGNPNDWPTRWQQFSTQAAGRRVLATRAANLTLAENEAETLIPRVRQASANVSRTQYPSLNSVILAAKQGTGDPNVIKLGVAASALIPVYARVLKPNGQITEGDTGRATEILNKAWSDGQINAALDQMVVELKSARSALTQTTDEYGMPKKEGGEGAHTQQAPASAPAGNVIRWERGPDGTPRPVP